MTLRYLFGPVSPEYARERLERPRQEGHCLVFDHQDGVDLAIGQEDAWEAICAKLPAGWHPDFVALHLPYRTVPHALWSAPVPLVGLAVDWNLLWHHYRRRLRSCELILTDTLGVTTFAREGLEQARVANLFGCEQSFLSIQPAPERDIDILFVGNLNPAVQAERLAWLGRLSRLCDRRRVEIHTGIHGNAYRDLLARAKIVFNLSIRGECNRRVFEAAAAGALLIQEKGNLEVPTYFADGQEFLSYTSESLESLLDYYLDHEDERRQIAENARRKVADLSFENLWARQIELIERDWPTIVERSTRRLHIDGDDELLARTWQLVGSSPGHDSTLFRDLRARVKEQPTAELFNALGIAVACINNRGSRFEASLAHTAVEFFEQACALDPQDVVAGLNLVEALAGLQQFPRATEVARRVLAVLDSDRPLSLDGPHFPPVFDPFRVQWERAAWTHAGDRYGEAQAKRELLRWRLHSYLGEITEELGHFYEACVARADLPTSRAALGAALYRGKRFGQALPHLRRAVADNPFDSIAARALFDALGVARDQAGQRRLARDRRLLARTAPAALREEDVYKQMPPPGDELASIIILCWNELDYTRQCLESVLRHTRRPYELLLVNNGSSDGTRAFLEEIRQLSGPERVVVIHNESNLGFAAGCNQGLQASRGSYLILLNNDTIVTEGWLDGLVRWSLHKWPRVGMVGPVTSYAAPPQQIPVDYRDPSGIDAFAARRRREFARKALAFPRLTGFCLLLRREVLDKIGSLDEGYGTGFFEDDDLCVRARKAGFELLVALDVFVHHFGSRTFTGQGVDYRKQLEENFGMFRAKWGDEVAAPYRLPEASEAVLPMTAVPVPRPLTASEDLDAPMPVRDRMRVSLCMIVKNEEDNLPACLESCRGLFDEIVVVDTGSTDRTKEVAARYGARLADFPWVDSFCAARNESLQHATGDWIFWMDADDRLDDENRAKLKAFLAGLKDENVAYSMKCLCVPDRDSGTATVVDHVRLFRNHPQIRWRYRVHEQILPTVRKAGGDVRWADVVIRHVGYQDPALRRRKLDRDLRLLHLEDEEHPDDPFTLFNLGMVYQELGQLDKAVPALRRSLQRSHPNDSIVRKLYALLAQCHRHLGQRELALAASRKGREFYPDDVELLFQEGLVCRELGKAAEAEQCWLRLLEPKGSQHFASVDTGIAGHKTRHNLAVMYHEQKRDAEAETQWRQALAEQPAFVSAWLGLGELFLRQERWDEHREVVQELEHLGLVADASILRARAHQVRREYDDARQLLEQTIEHAPQAVYPNRILSHVLLQQGKDTAAAEKALRRVLELVPDDPEATQNLAVLLHDRRRDG
ncbi:MAG: glycosyltransferase [Gemmataceae bacterium]